VTEIIDKGESTYDVNGVTDTGYTAMHMAADGNYVGIVTSLLKTHASTIDLNIRGGVFLNTPLHLAAYKGHHKVVSLLTGAKTALGKPLADTSATNKFTETPLQTALARKTKPGLVLPGPEFNKLGKTVDVLTRASSCNKSSFFSDPRAGAAELFDNPLGAVGSALAASMDAVSDVAVGAASGTVDTVLQTTASLSPGFRSNIEELRVARVKMIWNNLPKEPSDVPAADKSTEDVSDTVGFNECWEAVFADESLAPLMTADGNDAAKGKQILNAMKGMHVLHEAGSSRLTEPTLMKICDRRLLTIACDASEMMN